MFSGPLGYIFSIGLIILFVKSFTWRKEIAVQVNPDEQLGSAFRRAFSLLNKRDE